MQLSLSELFGIGPARLAKLEVFGIVTPFDLLKRCRTPRERRQFHEGTGLGPDQLLDWALTADLMRIPGVDATIAKLLRSAGVDGVVALRHRNATWLAGHLSRLAPEELELTSERVAEWIGAAQALPTVVHY